MHTGARIEVFAPGFTSIHTCNASATNVSCVPLTDASCEHTMDVGVVCSSYQEVYNVTRVALDQLQTQCLATEQTTTITATLGEQNTDSYTHTNTFIPIKINVFNLSIRGDKVN